MKLLKPRRSNVHLPESSSTTSLISPNASAPILSTIPGSLASLSTSDLTIASPLSPIRLPSERSRQKKVISAEAGERSKPPSSFLSNWGMGLGRVKSFRGGRRGSNASVSDKQEAIEILVDGRVDGLSSDSKDRRDKVNQSASEASTYPSTTALKSNPLPSLTSRTSLQPDQPDSPDITANPIRPSKKLNALEFLSESSSRGNLPTPPRPSLTDSSSDPPSAASSTAHLIQHPLQGGINRPRAFSSSPNVRSPTPSPSPPGKKLVKRRPSSVVNDIELVERRSSSRTASNRDGSKTSTPPLSPVTNLDLFPPFVFRDTGSISLTRDSILGNLPEGAEAPVLPVSSLNRNASSSTAASSFLGPTTDESVMLESGDPRLSNAYQFDRELRISSTHSDDEDSFDNQAKIRDEGELSDSHPHPDTSNSVLRHAGSESTVTTILPHRMQPPSPAPHLNASTIAVTEDPHEPTTTRPEIRIRTTSLHSPHSIQLTQATPQDQSPVGIVKAHRRSVTFDQHSWTENLRAEGLQRTLRKAATQRALGVRPRSKSLGRPWSMDTTSVYSVGEVITATRTMLVEAQAVRIDTRELPHNQISVETSASSRVEPTTQPLNLFDADVSYDDWLSPAETYSSGLRDPRKGTESSSTNRDTRRKPRRESISTRPAPLPPHLYPRKSSMREPPRTAPLLPAIPTDSYLSPLLTDEPRRRNGSRTRTEPSSPSKMQPNDDLTPESGRPGMPQRQGSFSRLWRTLSGGGRGKKKAGQDVSLVPLSSTAPNSAVLSDQEKCRVSTRFEETRSPVHGTHGPGIDGMIEPVPPVPEARILGSRYIESPQSRLVSISSPSLQDGAVFPEIGTKNIDSRRPFDSYCPIPQNDLNHSASAIPEAATPLLEISIPNTERRRHRRSCSTDKERRRRYRQTLVEIKDDLVFQEVLADLARLEEQSSTDSFHPSYSAVAGNLGRTREIERSSARTWFVIRELVQGERRYGRLLAKGVATVTGAARSGTSVEFFRNSSTSSSTTTTPKNTLKGKRPKLSAPPSVSEQKQPLSTRMQPQNQFPMHSNSLDLLLSHLPPLLAVSLTLSSRFEHDPSPLGIAESFLSMERELTREIGNWASEVGNLVAMGMGEILDRSSEGVSRRRSRGAAEGGTALEQGDDRLSFADILIMPIQRASRYKLLFQELLSTPNSSSTKDELALALKASERLATECDKRQNFDLGAFTRSSSSSSSSVSTSTGYVITPGPGSEAMTLASKRNVKRRTVSVGPGSLAGSFSWLAAD